MNNSNGLKRKVLNFYWVRISLIVLLSVCSPQVLQDFKVVFLVFKTFKIYLICFLFYPKTISFWSDSLFNSSLSKRLRTEIIPSTSSFFMDFKFCHLSFKLSVSQHWAQRFANMALSRSVAEKLLMLRMFCFLLISPDAR